jgi:hypothetical protein
MFARKHNQVRYHLNAEELVKNLSKLDEYPHATLWVHEVTVDGTDAHSVQLSPHQLPCRGWQLVDWRIVYRVDLIIQIYSLYRRVKE